MRPPALVTSADKLVDLCLPGLFGPSCSPCPSGCPTCDDSITGSGRCLTIVALNGTAAGMSSYPSANGTDK